MHDESDPQRTGWLGDWFSDFGSNFYLVIAAVCSMKPCRMEMVGAAILIAYVVHKNWNKELEDCQLVVQMHAEISNYIFGRDPN